MVASLVYAGIGSAARIVVRRLLGPLLKAALLTAVTLWSLTRL